MKAQKNSKKSKVVAQVEGDGVLAVVPEIIKRTLAENRAELEVKPKSKSGVPEVNALLAEGATVSAITAETGWPEKKVLAHISWLERKRAKKILKEGEIYRVTK